MAAKDDKIWAGHYKQGTSDKVWCGGVRGTTFCYLYGRRYGNLVHGHKVFQYKFEAMEWLGRKIGEKIGEGYMEVPIGDRRYGIPHPFAQMDAAQGRAAPEIVEENSPEDIRRRMRLAVEEAKKEGLVDD